MKRFSIILFFTLTGCAVGPDYTRPDAPLSSTFKELEGWTAARPQDDVPRGSVCTTDAISTLIEELQYTLGEGPVHRRAPSPNPDV